MTGRPIDPSAIAGGDAVRGPVPLEFLAMAATEWDAQDEDSNSGPARGRLPARYSSVVLRVEEASKGGSDAAQQAEDFVHEVTALREQWEATAPEASACVAFVARGLDLFAVDRDAALSGMKLLRCVRWRPPLPPPLSLFINS